MNIRSAVAAAAMMALPLVANAQAINGPYVGVGAGVNFMHNENIGVAVGAGSASGDAKMKLGPVVVVNAGWGFGNGFRAEVEGAFRHNQFNGIKGSGAFNSLGGNEQKYGAMLNLLYDFATPFQPVGFVPAVSPYVGLGAGYQWAMLQSARGVGPAGTLTIPDETKGSFAAQAILGMAVPIAAIPGLAFTAEYRFMALIEDRKYPARVTPFVGPTGVGTATFKDDYNHSILIGMRYAFGQAPARVVETQQTVPAQAQVPARSYLVFFDWDKATLTDRARQIIAEAAAASTKVQVTRIEVNGYTDTSGTPQYNQNLSVRRANAVAAELVSKGVPRNAITIQGFGETRPLVPTGDGVREPQNRRVEIILR
jgi:OOP family OmpA-OmpF porin